MVAVLRVGGERLAAAAAQVGGHGEDLAVAHLRADNDIESAAAGWAGRSATTLDALAARWTSASAALVARLGAHATELHTAALAFAAMEADNTGAFCPDAADFGFAAR